MRINLTKKVLLSACLFLCQLSFCIGQILVKNELSPQQMVEEILLSKDGGVVIRDVNYTGSERSIGVFYSNAKSLPFAKGLVLSTGFVTDIDGPNKTTNMGTPCFNPGDAELDEIAKGNSTDAAILEFTFIPNTDSVSFSYFFASEEYPEFVNYGVNDVFAFFISGPGIQGMKNMAVLPFSNDPVTVDNVNSKSNANFFIENKIWNPNNLKASESVLELSYSLNFDGLTTLLKASSQVIPYKPYKFKIAIADVGDNIYDSGVFLKANSFKSKGNICHFSKLIKEELKGLEFNDTTKSIIIKDNKVYVHSNIQFNFNSHEVLSEYHSSLNNFANILNQYFDVKLIIVGHTDDIGSDTYNQELSLERAMSIKKYLVNNQVDKQRIRIIGKGNANPVVRGNSEKDRALNRRIEFIIEK